jgi:hypothetical protein
MHMAGFALIAALAFSVIGAASAFATSPEWLVNGAAVTASVKVDSEGTVVLTDLNAKVKLECTGTDKGTVGASAPASKTSEETTVTATECKTLEGSCPSPSAKAFGLPWKLELSGTAPTTLKFLSESGYEVVCAGFVKDTCKAAAGVPVLELLLPVEDPLHFEFPVAANENNATCSLNNKKEGDAAGLVFVLAEETGKLLEVS